MYYFFRVQIYFIRFNGLENPKSVSKIAVLGQRVQIFLKDKVAAAPMLGLELPRGKSC